MFISRFVGTIGLLLLIFADTSIATGNSTFSCGGKLEFKVWQLWDNSAREYIKTQQLTRRLQEKGDTYALYDIQTYTHNLAAMARRCQRFNRLEQLANLLGKAYAELEFDAEGRAEPAWICRGGTICNQKNRLINREVMLNSAQFLALTASVANGLVHAPEHRKRRFIEKTASVSVQHLLRWGDAKALRAIRKKLGAKPQDVKSGSTRLLFSDKYLWMISMYADLAGLFHKQSELSTKVTLTDNQRQAMSEHLTLLLRLFSERITVMEAVGRDGKAVKTADLDRGFWRLRSNNRYAGYGGSEKPAICIPQADAPAKIKIVLDSDQVRPVNDLSWDISHARRLVHVFDSLERNRQALREIFRVDKSILSSAEITRAFARQLIVHVWNGNKEYPLFSNYWSGANGWYRVAYDNGTPRCMEGYPPFGLSQSFVTGGYASWSRYVPEIRLLARRLYELSNSNDVSHRLFIDNYYPKLGKKASSSTRMLTQLEFWPSLVEVSQ